ncbi:hypothetical protein [Falsigemmobacter intermedius]|uniref:hypothetical protein n=1 Tax=Falsigemmobacter intermedius TaxID=1553448 RepID=UPI003F12A39E
MFLEKPLTLPAASPFVRLIAGAAPDARAALKLPEALRGTAEPKPAFDLQAAQHNL